MASAVHSVQGRGSLRRRSASGWRPRQPELTAQAFWLPVAVVGAPPLSFLRTRLGCFVPVREQP